MQGITIYEAVKLQGGDMGYIDQVLFDQIKGIQMCASCNSQVGAVPKLGQGAAAIRPKLTTFTT